MISVQEIMTPDPHTLGPDSTLCEVRRLMAEHHIRHVPIVGAGGRLAGLVTERDVLAAMGSVLDPDRQQREDAVPIGSFMKPDPITITPRDSLRGAALFMEKHRYGCLPVVEDGRLCGIVTDSDFVGLAINLLEQAEDPD